jgi:23S rRNA (cytosine1962-C5)-methyltransferase
MERLSLHPGKAKRLLQGHRWIFSNEIASPLSEFEPGSWVDVYSSDGVALGSGYVNPRSLIAVRIVCPPAQEPTREFITDAIRKADVRRERIYSGSSCYRMVYAESDGLPGLVVDRYGDVLVYQISTLGMARLEPMIREILLEELKPRALVFRNDLGVRTLEGLPLEKGIARGEVPEDFSVNLDGLILRVDPLEGQKTGLYLDQRDNRSSLARWAKGKRVLDLFCYNGAWGMAAASFGAVRVTGVDQSAQAVAQASLNARANKLDRRCEFVSEDAFRFLKTVPKGEFDLMILDPPAFAKTKSALADARKGYADLNRRALLALSSGGLLITCSCSYHMQEEMFHEALLRAAQASGRKLRLLDVRGQAADHPALLAMPETRYLKCLILEVI